MNSIAGSNPNRDQTLKMHSLPVSSPQACVVAIRQEGIRVATAAGLIDAQLIKILRINHTPMPQHQRVDPRARQMRRLPSRSNSNISSPVTRFKPAIETPHSEVPSRGKNVGLRSVGEVLTDQTGYFYEMRGEELHTLGELVTDPQGRLFEVCQYTGNSKANNHKKHVTEASQRTPDAVQQPETKKRDQIPPRYVNPRQAKYSREEVLYDMRATFGTLPPNSSSLARLLFIYPLRLVRTLLTVAMSHWQLRKWRALLEGKNAEEQLWAIKPPRRFAYLPEVREWAETTLARAGYDPKRMLLEWEIYWRCSGIV